MKNRIIRYLIYLIIVVIIFYFDFIILQHMKAIYRSTYHYPISMIPAWIGFPLIIGVLLGMDSWMSDQQKPGQWQVNWPKLILLGIPALAAALYIPLGIVLGCNNISLPIPFPSVLIILFETTRLQEIAALIFGYVLISSFYKEDQIIEASTSEDI